MPTPSTPGSGGADSAPSMLDLVRLSPRMIFPPGGRDLARQIALLTDMREGLEVLDVGCGKAVSLEFFAREYGIRGSGVESDPRLVEQANDRLREEELAVRVQVQQGSADRLPYRDAIFDVSVGEIGMTADASAADAVRELVRVTRPGGAVVLVQSVWKAPVDEDRKRLLISHLGVKPGMLVEWKRLLRENGVTQILTEDWSDEETAFRGSAAKPFPDFAELFSLPEKLGILRRAWSRYGWTGVRAVLEREREIHRLLTRERLLGLDLLKGIRDPEVEDGRESGEVPHPMPGRRMPDRRSTPNDTPELPLFDEDS